jgi:hypothetical protein
LARQARADLDDIETYLQREAGVLSTQRMLARISDKIDLLADFPALGVAACCCAALTSSSIVCARSAPTLSLSSCESCTAHAISPLCYRANNGQRPRVHLPSLRRDLAQMGRQMRRVRRMEYAGGGDGAHRRARRTRSAPAAARRAKPSRSLSLPASPIHRPRIATGISEFDRVCGGGLVPASAILIGGDPGVGKSTLLLQAAASLAARRRSVAYVTGEEAEAQVQERARRLKAADATVHLAAETDLRKILEGLKTLKPDVVVVDSIQTRLGRRR